MPLRSSVGGICGVVRELGDEREVAEGLRLRVMVEPLGHRDGVAGLPRAARLRDRVGYQDATRCASVGEVYARCLERIRAYIAERGLLLADREAVDTAARAMNQTGQNLRFALRSS